MRQSFEMLEICGFWHEISNITRTRLEYIVTHERLQFFPAKNRPRRLQLHHTLETRVWESNEDQR